MDGNVDHHVEQKKDSECFHSYVKSRSNNNNNQNNNMT
jgi:hypothetical protein